MKKTILFGLAAAMLVTACSEEDDLRNHFHFVCNVTRDRHKF